MYENDFNPYEREKEVRNHPYPVRRAFARVTDMFIFSTVVTALYAFVLGRGIYFAGMGEMIKFIPVCAAFSAVFEAIMLSMMGTTPGKWLFGIRLLGGYGRKMGFKDALTRNFKRLIMSEALYIPIISWITLYKSYKACDIGLIMDYDDYTVYEIREKPLFVSLAGSVMCVAAALAMTVVITVCGMAAPNKGDIDIWQFMENYNHMVDYTYSADINRKLDESLRFYSEHGSKPYENTSVSFERIGKGEILDGIGLKIKGFNYNYRNTYDYGNEMMFIIMSLADSSFSERFSVLMGKIPALGLDSDMTVEFADVKAEYSVKMENMYLDIRRNADSRISGGTVVSAGMVKNPDGTYTQDKSKAFSVSYGRGRHMFMPKNEEEKSLLEMSFTARKAK